jgi:hypothetical protein
MAKERPRGWIRSAGSLDPAYSNPSATAAPEGPGRPCPPARRRRSLRTRVLPINRVPGHVKALGGTLPIASYVTDNNHDVMPPARRLSPHRSRRSSLRHDLRDQG